MSGGSSLRSHHAFSINVAAEKELLLNGSSLYRNSYIFLHRTRDLPTWWTERKEKKKLKKEMTVTYYLYDHYIVVVYFNSQVMQTLVDEVALFWGITYYNTELLQADENQLGSVTTEILLKKDLDSFTFQNGWAFPRRIYFDGENCEMALPDVFPMLPNGSSSLNARYPKFFTLLLIFFILDHLLS